MSIEFKESVEAEAIGSDNDKPAGSGHALAIIVPTAIVRPAVASAMLLLKLIADAGGQRQPAVSRLPTSANPNTRAAYAVAVRAARGGEEEMWRRAPPPYRNYSLTIWAPSKEHCANYERCVTK
jgi:hypothetical protein